MDDERDPAALHLAAAHGSVGIALDEMASARVARVPATVGAPPTISGAAASVKRAIDVVLSLVLLLLLAPLLLLAGVAVLLSGWPILFAQPRVGLHGRIFQCYKFRSMVTDAELVLQELLQYDAAARAEWQRSQKLRRDPRLTGIGALLRRSSIDELPQLWNVLRGDMSLVGPRPVMVDQLPLYGSLAACYTSIRPGITGLWQVTARGDDDFARRITLDCEYVRHHGLVSDLWILLKTVRVVLSGAGAY